MQEGSEAKGWYPYGHVAEGSERAELLSRWRRVQRERG